MQVRGRWRIFVPQYTVMIHESFHYASEGMLTDHMTCFRKSDSYGILKGALVACDALIDRKLQGIFSWESTSPCSRGLGVFSKVRLFTDWIKETLESYWWPFQINQSPNILFSRDSNSMISCKYSIALFSSSSYSCLSSDDERFKLASPSFWRFPKLK